MNLNNNHIRITQADVDKEIKTLEKKYNDGEENTSLYKIKLDNLKTIKNLLLQEIQYGEKKKKNQRDDGRGESRSFTKIT